MSNSVNIELTGSETKFIGALNRTMSAVRGQAGRTMESLRSINRTMLAGYEKLGLLGKLGIGFGVFEMAKDMMEFDDSLRKIGRTSGATTAEMLGLRSQIMQLIAPGSGIPLTKNQFIEMADALNATGISMQTIKAVLPEIGKGAVAARVDTKIYAETIGELLEKYKVAVTDLPALQEQLHAAMKMEDVRKNPEAFLQTISGLAKTMQLMRSSGLQNVTSLLALQTQLTRFTGSASEAGAVSEAIFNGLLRISKNRELAAGLKGVGVNFFDSKGNVKHIGEIIGEIKKLAVWAERSGKGIDAVSAAVFGRPEAAKAVLMTLRSYDDVIKTQENFRTTTKSMGRDLKTEVESMSKKLEAFQNQMDRFKVDHFSQVLKGLSNVLTTVNEHPAVVKGILSVAGLTAITMGVNKLAGAFSVLGAVIKANPIIATALLAYGAGSAFIAHEGKQVEKMTGGKYKGSGFLGEMIYDWTHKDQAPVKNDINLSVQIDKDGRIRTKSDDTFTSIAIKRGDLGHD